MNRESIFISHVTEEAGIANTLKTLLEEKFLNMFNVFVSSHPDSLKLGDKWFDVIMENISKAKLVIVICSPLSEKRPWINFEAGCGFIKQIPVIPLCHSGLTPGDLSFPLKALQGAELNSLQSLQELLNRIAGIFGIDSPKMTSESVLSTISNFESSVRNSLSYNAIVRIDAILKDSIQATKFAIMCSVTDFADTHSSNIDSIDFEFKNIHNLFSLSPLLAELLRKNYEILYERINELKENIKFVLLCNRFNQIEIINNLFDEFIIGSDRVVAWYSNMLMLDKNESLKNSIIEEVKKCGVAPPDYQISNLINSFISCYESIIYLRGWIKRYEATAKSIIDSATKNLQ